MKAILLEEAHTIRAASKVYQLTMVLEPRSDDSTLSPIFGQPAPFSFSNSTKLMGGTCSFFANFLCSRPVCSRVSPQICAHSHWRKIPSHVPHGSEHQSARSISIPKGLGPCSFSNISQEWPSQIIKNLLQGVADVPTSFFKFLTEVASKCDWAIPRKEMWAGVHAKIVQSAERGV